MSADRAQPHGVTHCRHLRTKRESFAVFRHWASPRNIAIGLAGVLLIRLLIGDWSWWDLGAVAIVVVANPFTEWFIHLFVLHGQPLTIGRFTLDNGSGHRQHHLDPYEIQFVLLRGVDAAVFQVMIAAFVFGLTVPILWLLDAPILAPFVSALVFAQLKLLEYEWDHFLFHTSYRPNTRWYRRLKQNHRLHHWRNERYWLGVTNNFGDRVLRSYPRTKTDVPLSPTARTLDADPEAA